MESDVNGDGVELWRSQSLWYVVSFLNVFRCLTRLQSWVCEDDSSLITDLVMTTSARR